MFKVLGPVLVLVGISLVLATLPEVFPDHGVVSGAIYEGNLERMRELLDCGADPIPRRATLSTLSRFLTRTGYTSHIDLDFSERAPLLIEALNRPRFAIAKLLLDRGADPNVSDEYRQTALARAREMEAPAPLVQLLLAPGVRSREIASGWARNRGFVADGGSLWLNIGIRDRVAASCLRRLDEIC